MPVRTNPSVRAHVCIMRCGSITLKRAVRSSACLWQRSSVIPAPPGLSAENLHHGRSEALSWSPAPREVWVEGAGMAGPHMQGVARYGDGGRHGQSLVAQGPMNPTADCA